MAPGCLLEGGGGGQNVFAIPEKVAQLRGRGGGGGGARRTPTHFVFVFVFNRKFRDQIITIMGRGGMQGKSLWPRDVIKKKVHTILWTAAASLESRASPNIQVHIFLSVHFGVLPPPPQYITKSWLRYILWGDVERTSALGWIVDSDARIAKGRNVLLYTT